MKRLLFAVPVAAFIALVTVFGLGLTKDPSKLPSQLIDRPLPVFALPGIAAINPESGGFASTVFRGQPALINVFASWCSACPPEHPMLGRIKAEGVPVYGIAWKDKPADTRDWLAKLGNPYTAIAADESGRTAIDLGVTGAPESFIVDKAGRVRYKVVGAITPEIWDATLKPLIAKLRTEA